MAKFKFKLQNILNVKEKLEGQAKAEYGIEITKLRQEQEKKEQMELQQQQWQENLRETLQSALHVSKILQWEQVIEMLKQEIQMQAQVIVQQEYQVAKAREKLDKAMQERKTYEKLKEKAFEDFRLALNAAEQKEVDELISFTHGSTQESEE